MNPRLLAVALLGVLAIHAYGAGFSAVFYQVLHLTSSSERPSPWQWYPSVIAVSFLFGFVGALLTRYIAPPNARSAASFVAGAVLSFLASTFFFAGGAGVVAQLSSYGFWGFVLGASVVFFLPQRVAT